MKNLKPKTYLLFIIGLFYLSPSSAHASTYQDVQQTLNANPAPPGCVNWVEEVTTEAGNGYKVWQRCTSSTYQVRYVYDNPTSTGWVCSMYGVISIPPFVYSCDGAGGKVWPDVSCSSSSADKRTIYLGWSLLKHVTVSCTGQTSTVSYNLTSPTNPGLSSSCWYASSPYIDCRSYDSLLAEFTVVDQCLNKLTNTPASCFQNCKDPVDKAAAAATPEICGDGIDNNCDGQIDEGCGIQLPETVYQCEDEFKVTPPFYNETQNSICTAGCALADITMVLNYYLNKAGLPMVEMKGLNEWLNLHKGYSDGGKVNWWALNEYPGANIKFVKSSDIEDIAKLNDELINGNPVVLKVFNPQTGRDHFVVAVGKSGSTWDIIDPGYQPQKTTLSERYGNHFKGIRGYESK